MGRGKDLTYEDRLLIESLLSEGTKIEDISRRLERNPSTIYCEIKRGKINGKYSAETGQEYRSFSRKRKAKRRSFFAKNPEWAEYVSVLIKKGHGVIWIADYLSNSMNIPMSKQVLYSSIQRGDIPDITMKDLKKREYKVTSTGHIMLPYHIIKALAVKPGDVFQFETSDDDEATIIMKRVT